jgi:hypothetical protein
MQGNVKVKTTTHSGSGFFCQIKACCFGYFIILVNNCIAPKGIATLV